MQNSLKAIVQIGKASLEDQSLAEVLGKIIKLLGQSYEIERAYLFESINEKYFSYTHEWTSDDVESFIGNPMLEKISWEDYSFIKNQFLKFGVYTTHTKDIVDPVFKESIEMQGIVSLIFVPIFIDDFLWGFIGLDACKNEKNWSEDETDLLITVSNYITALIKRKLLEQQNIDALTQLKQQKEFYLDILENLPADIVVFNKNHKYEYANTHAIKDDYVRNWIIGKDDYAYCKKFKKPLALADKRRHHFEQVCLGLKEIEFKEHMVSRDGMPITFLKNMKPVLNSDQSVKNVIGYGIDITSVIQTENRLLKLEEAINNSPDGIALLTPDGIYNYINRSHESIFGYDEGELIGKTWQVLYETNEIEYITNEVFPTLTKQKYWEGEINAKDKNGKQIAQDVKLKRLADDSLLCITRDISNIKKNNLLLKYTNNKLDLAIRSSNLAMWEWNIESDELKGNKIFNQYIGNQKKFTSKKWAQQIHPDDRADVINEYQKIFNGDINIIQLEYRITDKENNIRWILDTGSVTSSNKQGQPKEMLGCMVDITEIKKAKEEIFEAFNKQKELLELKSKFVSMASHEFRTPLANIRSTAEVIQLYTDRYGDLQEISSTYQIENKLQEIIAETDKMEHIMNDIFTIGKIENNSYKVIKSKMPAKHYIDDYFSHINKNVHKKFNIKISNKLNESQLVEIDKSSMDIVLNNIISNAIKYSSPNTQIDVNVRKSNKTVAIEICDYGIGIPTQDIENIFEKFYRSSNVSNTTGIGLGLAIAKYFSEMNSSKINIESIINEYTKVTINIPII
jgi:PAS domain S-box-containing protein